MSDETTLGFRQSPPRRRLARRLIVVLALLAPSAVPAADAPVQGRVITGPGAVLPQRQRVEPINAPGPTIGMWDNQGPTPAQGDWRLRADNGYAIEGNVKMAVPESDGQLVQIKLEQSAVWDGERSIYLAGRRTAWHVVGRAASREGGE